MMATNNARLSFALSFSGPWTYSSEKQPSTHTGRLTDPLDWRSINSKRQVAQKRLAEFLNKCVEPYHARLHVGPLLHNPFRRQAVG